MCIKRLNIVAHCSFSFLIEASAYFPIMFSAFEPESVELVDKFQPQTKQWRFSKHHGDWRIFSFGMYVLAGSDAAQLTMDESFVGWYVV
jgi:hypothetical protein